MILVVIIYIYIPVFKYSINGKEYIRKGFSQSYKQFEVGQQVKINYNREKPEISYLDEEYRDTDGFIFGMCAFFGAIFVFLLIIVFFLCM